MTGTFYLVIGDISEFHDNGVQLSGTGGNRLLSLNARSLGIEKADGLLTVSHLNNVSCVCVTETWFKDYTAAESVGLAGISCERKDRKDKRGGGVACYIRDTMVYTRINDIEDSEHEVLGIKMRPRRLPRQYSCIILASMREHQLGHNLTLSS